MAEEVPQQKLKLAEELKKADELMEKGSNAVANYDFKNASIYFRCAIKIRDDLYGEPCLESIDAYYRAGVAFFFNTFKLPDDVDEDDALTVAESMDLAWSMLDAARKIAEKNPADTLEKAQILILLGRIAMTRGSNLEPALAFHQNALSMLQRLIDPPDSELIIRQYMCVSIILFKMSKPHDGILQHKNAISTLHSLIERLYRLYMHAGTMSETSIIPLGYRLDVLRSLNDKVVKVEADTISRLDNEMRMLKLELKSLQSEYGIKADDADTSAYPDYDFPTIPTIMSDDDDDSRMSDDDDGSPTI